MARWWHAGGHQLPVSANCCQRPQVEYDIHHRWPGVTVTVLGSSMSIRYTEDQSEVELCFNHVSSYCVSLMPTSMPLILAVSCSTCHSSSPGFKSLSCQGPPSPRLTQTRTPSLSLVQSLRLGSGTWSVWWPLTVQWLVAAACAHSQRRPGPFDSMLTLTSHFPTGKLKLPVDGL
jgi:hypothetical protein